MEGKTMELECTAALDAAKTDKEAYHVIANGMDEVCEDIFCAIHCDDFPGMTDGMKGYLTGCIDHLNAMSKYIHEAAEDGILVEV